MKVSQQMIDEATIYVNTSLFYDMVRYGITTDTAGFLLTLIQDGLDEAQDMLDKDEN